MLKALQVNENVMYYAEVFNRDVQFLLEAIGLNHNCATSIDLGFLKKRVDEFDEFVLKVVKMCGCLLKKCDKQQREWYYHTRLDEVYDGIRLEDGIPEAHIGFQKWENARTNFIENVQQFKFIPIEFMKDSLCILQVLKQSSIECQYLDLFYNDKQVMLQAVKSDLLDSLEMLSDALKSDREFMLEVVGCNGAFLEYASNAIKNDREIVLVASKRGGFQFASKSLKSDLEFVLNVIELDGSALQHVPEDWLSDWNFIFRAVKCNFTALSYTPLDISQNREYIRKLIPYHPCEMLGHASVDLQCDPELLLEAIQYNYNAFFYCNSGQVILDREFFLQCVKRNGCVIR